MSERGKVTIKWACKKESACGKKDKSVYAFDKQATPFNVGSGTVTRCCRCGDWMEIDGIEIDLS